MSEKHVGEVVQVIGPVLDIRFAHDELPALLNAIEVDNKGAKLIVEVAQQIGDNTVRCIAMSSTDGLVRGMKAVDTGGPITVPVGEECLGRVFNLLGEPVDNRTEPEIETIAKFEELGCTLDGIVKVKERYTHFGSDEHALIPAFKMTVKEA